MEHLDFEQPARTESARTRTPGAVSSLVYLLLNFPLGLVWFVLLVTLYAVGFGTVIVWVGLPVLIVTLLITRGMANLEVGRANALLSEARRVHYRPLPPGFKAGMLTRLKDQATWRAFGYVWLYLPLACLEFAAVMVTWGVGLQFLALPIYYRFIPGGWSFPSMGDGPHWIVVDSLSDSWPWAALGLLLCALGVLVTKKLAPVHARFTVRALGAVRTEGSDYRGY